MSGLVLMVEQVFFMAGGSFGDFEVFVSLVATTFVPFSETSSLGMGIMQALVFTRGSLGDFESFVSFALFSKIPDIEMGILQAFLLAGGSSGELKDFVASVALTFVPFPKICGSWIASLPGKGEERSCLGKG